MSLLKCAAFLARLRASLVTCLGLPPGLRSPAALCWHQGPGSVAFSASAPNPDGQVYRGAGDGLLLHFRCGHLPLSRAADLARLIASHCVVILAAVNGRLWLYLPDLLASGELAALNRS